MSTAEIIDALESLPLADRRAICKRILELEEDRESMQFSVEAAAAGFRVMEQAEGEDS